VTSCLELVRNGDLNISDAQDSFRLWGHRNDESLSRKLVLLKAMTEKEDEEPPFVTPTPTRSPYGVMHTPLPDAEKDEFDLGDLGVLMSIIKGLGLQLPTDDNDTVTAEANEKKINEILKPEMTEEQILGLFSGFLNSDGAGGEGSADGENMREIEWLLENDPAAAAELLAPLLAGGETELQEYLKSVIDSEVVTTTTATTEENAAVTVSAGGKSGTVLSVAEEETVAQQDPDEVSEST
jgi:hypothetical protein